MYGRGYHESHLDMEGVVDVQGKYQLLIRTLPNIHMEKVRPPYKSEWPSEIPTKEELEKYEKREEDMSDKEWARVSISYSVKDLNIHNFQWSSHRLGEPREQTREEMYEDFVHSLGDKQRKAWECYRSVQGKFAVESFRQYMDRSIVPENSESELNKRISEDTLKSAEKSFIKTLGKKKFKIYKEIVVPYLSDPHLDRDKYLFDLSIAHRWILKRIFDLGWTTEYFGSFDASVLRSHDRREKCRPESIGKKYQWIAYHEFLARLSDNFEFRNDLGFRKEDYDGPWQLDYIRDIDPSNLLRKTKREVGGPNTNTWWFPPSYDSWDSECDDVKWLKNSKDIPPFGRLVEVANPDGKEWLVLEGYYSWEQPIPPEEERFEMPRREIWYTIRSYIVKKTDINSVFEWAKKQNFMIDRMPKSYDLPNVFLGEFFWSGAHKYYCEHSLYRDWTRGDRGCIPREVLVTTQKYSWGDQNCDCSQEENIYIYLPAEWLVQQMNLQWNRIEGQFSDKNGELMAFDPSVVSSGPGTLLINRDAFLDFLDKNGYDILWTIVGEKIILGEISRDKWKGKLLLSGAYRIEENMLCGKINKKFISPMSLKEEI